MKQNSNNIKKLIAEVICWQCSQEGKIDSTENGVGEARIALVFTCFSYQAISFYLSILNCTFFLPFLSRAFMRSICLSQDCIHVNFEFTKCRCWYFKTGQSDLELEIQTHTHTLLKCNAFFRLFQPIRLYPASKYSSISACHVCVCVCVCEHVRHKHTFLPEFNQHLQSMSTNDNSTKTKKTITRASLNWPVSKLVKRSYC